MPALSPVTPFQTTKELVTNPYLLSMSQNDLGQQGYVVRREGDAYVLVKDADRAYGTARFLALYNAGDKVKDFSVDFAAVDLAGDVEVLDLCERTDLGVRRGSLTATVPPHGVRFYRLDAARRLDRTVYEAETAFLPAYHELDEKPKAGTPRHEQCAAASGGVVVSGLGGAVGNDLVWKDVRVSAAGRYRFEIGIIAESDFSFSA